MAHHYFLEKASKSEASLASGFSNLELGGRGFDPHCTSRVRMRLRKCRVSSAHHCTQVSEMPRIWEVSIFRGNRGDFTSTDSPFIGHLVEASTGREPHADTVRVHQRRLERSKDAPTCWPSGVSISTVASVEVRLDASYSSQMMKPVGREPPPLLPPPVPIRVLSYLALRDSSDLPFCISRT